MKYIKNIKSKASVYLGFWFCLSCLYSCSFLELKTDREHIKTIKEKAFFYKPINNKLITILNESQIEELSKPFFIEHNNIINIDFDNVIGNGPKFYGVEYSWIDQDKELYLKRYRELHGNVIRVQISQNFFEPTNDNNDPNYSEIDFSRSASISGQLGKTMTYEKMFKALVLEFPDMHFQINIWLCARWNATEPEGYLGLGGAFPPKDYAEHREFVRELAKWLINECRIQPDHLSFTFVNEPNLNSFFVGSRNDLIRMATETRTALNKVSSKIQMGGIDEVHGTIMTDGYYNNYKAGYSCSFWTFHVYKRGLTLLLETLLKRVAHLKQYGKVWVTEFADTRYGSPDAKMNFSSNDAALDFSLILGRLWPTGIDGIVHFRLSDTYTDSKKFDGWIGHGLFADSIGTHSDGNGYKPFPVYWVFANMYRELGGKEIVQTVAPEGLTIVSARKINQTNNQLAIHITNNSNEQYSSFLAITSFPSTTAVIRVLNNLEGDTPIEEATLGGKNMAFRINLPGKSSYLLIVDG